MKRLVLLLIPIIALSGCIGQKPTKILFKDEAVTIENVEVFPVEVYSDETVSLSFDVVSNAKDEIKNINVSIIEPSYLSLTSLKCGNEDFTGKKCTISLDSLEVKHVQATFRVLPIASAEVEQTLKTKVEYEYNGTAILSFQIVKQEEVEKGRKFMKYSQEASEADVKLKFDPGFLVKKVEAGKTTIVRDYMIYGTSFTLEMSVDLYKKIKNYYATLESLSLNFVSVKPVKEFCQDFKEIDNKLMWKKCKMVTEHRYVEHQPITYTRTICEPEDVPIELRCEFTNEEFEEPSRSGLIIANYDYGIKKIFEQEIKIIRR